MARFETYCLINEKLSKYTFEWAWLARNVLATMNVLVPEQTVFTYASS